MKNRHNLKSFVHILMALAVAMSVIVVPGLPASANVAPTADAGPDQTATTKDKVLLLGRMSDDELPDPEAVPTASWSVVSGPGAVQMAEPSDTVTYATFPTTGTYVLRLTVGDGAATDTDETTITILNAAANTITVPSDEPTIQDAVDAASHGDVVLVSPGTYEEDVYISKSITLASTYYTTGDPSAIDNTIIKATDIGTPAVRFVDGAGIESRIVGFTIDFGKDGVKISGNASIIDNKVIGVDTDAIDFSPDAAGMVIGNVLENNGDDGVDIDQSSVLIEGNEINDNVGDGIEIRSNDTTNPFSTIVIRDNRLSGNEKDGIQLIDNDRGSPPMETNALLIIERNIIADNLQAGVGLMDNGETGEDYRAADLEERILVYNNTFSGNDHGISGGDNLVALNNIFVDHTNIAVKEVDDDSVVAYNLFWNNGTDNSGSNLDVGTTVFADPMLDGAYRLLSGSPAIDAGIDSFSLPSGELVLNMSASEYSGLAPDLGVYETESAPPPNQAPTVDAGSNQTITLPSSASLSGTANDDGLPDPPGALTTTWSKQSGPGNVTFGNPAALSTSASFSAAGTYVLQLGASDGAIAVTDTLTVMVNPEPGPGPGPTLDPDIVGGADQATGFWRLFDEGVQTTSFYFGNPNDFAFFGDWDCDGVETPGLYRQSDGYVYLRNSNTQGIADISFFFGDPGDVPIAGDFDGDDCDTVSIYRPSEAKFYIINELGSADEGLGAADYSFFYGVPGDVPFVGDWTGNGVDTPGLRRNSDGFVYLRNTNTQGVADVSYFYGDPGDVVFTGDWDGDGDDTLGLYRPSNGFVYLRNTNSTGIADVQFPIGAGMYPVAGDQ